MALLPHSTDVFHVFWWKHVYTVYSRRVLSWQGDVTVWMWWVAHTVVLCCWFVDGFSRGGPVQLGPSAFILEKKPQLFPKGLPKEAVDERIQAAVGESRQPDSVTRQGVILPQCAPVRVAPHEVHTYKHVLWQPAEEEDDHSSWDESQGFLPARPLHGAA